MRRYKVIREHGLLVTNRTYSWLSKRSEAISCGQTVRLGNTGRFVAFMQLTSGISFDMLVESMQYVHDLKKYIFRLVFLHI